MAYLAVLENLYFFLCLKIFTLKCWSKDLDSSDFGLTIVGAIMSNLDESSPSSISSHPVASNMIRSNGSPLRTPSIRVKEWQVAMADIKLSLSTLLKSVYSLSKLYWKNTQNKHKI